MCARDGNVLVVAMVAALGAGCAVEVFDDFDDRWSAVEVRVFEGSPIAGNSVECAGLNCGYDPGVDEPAVGYFEMRECDPCSLRVGAEGGFGGTTVQLRLAPEPTYAMARVASYSDVGGGNEYPVSGWVMLEQWNDQVLAVGRYALMVDDERWIRGTFDTRSED